MYNATAELIAKINVKKANWLITKDPDTAKQIKTMVVEAKRMLATLTHAEQCELRAKFGGK